jgi:hypothetical protein
MIEPWETETRPVRQEHVLANGTCVRFRDFDTLGELAGLPGVVVGSRRYASGWRYDVDVGPGWGYTGLVKRSDIVKVGTL